MDQITLTSGLILPFPIKEKLMQYQDLMNTVVKKTRRAARKTKRHLVSHKSQYALLALSALLLNGNMQNQKKFDVFMKEKGIDPLEFWCPEWYEEKQAEL